MLSIDITTTLISRICWTLLTCLPWAHLARRLVYRQFTADLVSRSQTNKIRSLFLFVVNDD